MRSVSVCLFVCLFVCPLAYLQNHTSKFHEIFCAYYLWPWLDDSSIHYVLPVLWMTSSFHIMGHMVHGVGNTDVGAVLQQVVKTSNIFARGAMLFDCRRIQWQQIVHRCGGEVGCLRLPCCDEPRFAHKLIENFLPELNCVVTLPDKTIQKYH